MVTPGCCANTHFCLCSDWLRDELRVLPPSATTLETALAVAERCRSAVLVSGPVSVGAQSSCLGDESMVPNLNDMRDISMFL